MKYLIVILFMMLNLNLISKEKTEKKVNNQEIYIKIIDQKTSEYLVGVKNNDKYSNFDGLLKINKGYPYGI